MLTLRIGDQEYFDEATQQFIQANGQTIELEHSLVSVSKWEAKWKKPFLGRQAKTREETIDYIRCMTKTQNVKPELYDRISNQQILEVNKYSNDPMTATTIAQPEGKGGIPRVITSEEIYYYMTAFQIPFDPCQKWHFNRLMMLIRVCDEKNKPKKKMRKGDIARQRRSLNAARRAKTGSRG
jgi:hypothetical protein